MVDRRAGLIWSMIMAIEIAPNQKVRVTIKRFVNREGARKTLERLFLKDKAHSGPLDARTSNFEDKPKRRGGRIWTKHPNKLHLPLPAGLTANITATAQAIRDLRSAESFVEVAAQ